MAHLAEHVTVGADLDGQRAGMRDLAASRFGEAIDVGQERAPSIGHNPRYGVRFGRFECGWFLRRSSPAVILAVTRVHSADGKDVPFMVQVP